LLARAALSEGEVQCASSIRVLTYVDAVKFCDRAKPATEIEAKFSLQHAVATTLAKGAPELGDFLPERLARADIASLRSRVRVEVSERYASAYPERFGSGVIVTLADGAERAFDSPDALGDPEKPLSGAQIEAKARVLMEAGNVPSPLANDLVVAALSGDGPKTLSLLETALR